MAVEPPAAAALNEDSGPLAPPSPPLSSPLESTPQSEGKQSATYHIPRKVDFFYPRF